MSLPGFKAEALGAKCSECPLKDAPGILPDQVVMPRRKVMALVTDYPGKAEVEKNQFLVGPTGKMVDERILQVCNIPKHKLHITGARLCFTDTKIYATKDLNTATECCRPRLVNEIKRVNPKAILATGPVATRAVLHKPLENVLGAPSQPPNGLSAYPTIATFQPAMMFRDKWGHLPVIRSHFIRAFDLAEGVLEPWTWRQRYTELDEEMLWALREMDGDVAIDIESNSNDALTCAITIIGFGDRKRSVAVSWAYNPDTGGDGVENPRNRLQRHIKEAVLKKLGSVCLKVWQNGRYDRFVMRRHGIIVNPKTHRDIMLMHTMLSPRTKHSLAFQACVEFPAPRWKEEHDEARSDFDK